MLVARQWQPRAKTWQAERVFRLAGAAQQHLAGALEIAAVQPPSLATIIVQLYADLFPRRRPVNDADALPIGGRGPFARRTVIHV